MSAAIKTHSLSRQLIGGVLLAELLCAALFSVTAIGHEMHGRRRAFDVMLRGRADSLLGAVRDADDPEDNVTVDPTELVLPAQDLYEVLSPSGRVLGHSPASSADLLAALSSSHPPGYFNFRSDESTTRAPLRWRARHRPRREWWTAPSRHRPLRRAHLVSLA